MRKLSIFALGMVIAYSPISAFAEGEDETAKRGDTEITARVKATLIENDAASAPQIDVETRDGVVQLSGFVSNVDEKNRAADAVSDVDGVEDVRNNIALAPNER